MRWWRELRNPKLKCDCLGHKQQAWRRKVRRSAYGFNTVAEDWLQERTECSRCGEVLSPWKDIERLQW